MYFQWFPGIFIWRWTSTPSLGVPKEVSRIWVDNGSIFVKEGWRLRPYAIINKRSINSDCAEYFDFFNWSISPITMQSSSGTGWASIEEIHRKWYMTGKMNLMKFLIWKNMFVLLSVNCCYYFSLLQHDLWINCTTIRLHHQCELKFLNA